MRYRGGSNEFPVTRTREECEKSKKNNCIPQRRIGGRGCRHKICLSPYEKNIDRSNVVVLLWFSTACFDGSFVELPFFLMCLQIIFSSVISLPEGPSF